MAESSGKNHRYHHGDLREALLSAVDELVRTKGVDAVTLRECARMAGVSHAAPLHHFPDRTALLRGYVAWRWTLLAERMKQRRVAAGENAQEALIGVGMAYIEFGMKTPGLFGLLLRPELYPLPGAPGYDAGRAAYEELVGAVKRCTGGGADDVILVELAWSAVHGFVELQHLQQEQQE